MDDPKPEPGEMPPENAEDWDDEQWLEWLKATDAESDVTNERSPASMGGRVAHSAGGELLGNIMAGISEVIYGKKKTIPAIVIDASSDPADDEVLKVHLDHDHPEQSTAVYKSRPTTPPE